MKSDNPKGVIFDAGYRRFEGKHLGRASAIASLIWDDFKRSLGIKRKTGYKVGFFILLSLQLGTAGFFLFSSEVLEPLLQQSGTPQSLQNIYSLFYEFTSIFVMIMAAIVAPNLLCRDRKHNVFQLYLVRPIYASDYLLAKGAAIFLVLLLFAMGPNLILFGGKMFLAQDAIKFLAENQASLIALLFSGVVIAVFFSSYALGVASLTTSIGAAVGLTIGLIFLMGTVSSIAYFSTRDSLATIIDFGDSIYRVKDGIFFGELQAIEASVGDENLFTIRPLPIWAYLATAIGVVVSSIALLRLNYRREVER